MNQLFLFRKEMTPIRKLLLMKMFAGGIPISEYTATGNPLSFNTNVIKPLKSLLIPWTPIQSGTGDPSPSNVRPISGVSALNVWQYPENKLSITRTESQSSNGITFTPIKDASNKTVAVHVKGQKTSSNVFYNLNYANSSTLKFPPGTYKVYGETANVRYRVFITNAQGTEQSVYTPGSETFTIPDDALGSWARLRVDTENEVDETIYPIILASDATLNTIPVVFPALGKNLLNPATLEQGGIAENGTETVSSIRVRTGFIPVEEGKAYTLSATGFTGFTHFYDANKGSLGVNRGATNQTAPEGSAFVRCFFRNAENTDITPSDITNGQLEQSSSATAYEPYTNTVYGGSLDLTTGVLTAEWVKHYLSEYGWSYASSSTPPYFSAGLGTGKKKGVSNVLSSCFKTGTIAGTGNLQDLSIIGSTAGGNVFVRYDELTSSTDFTNAVGNEYIVFELDEPITIQLTPTQITALLGDNTIWSDTNGSNTAVYLKKG